MIVVKYLTRYLALSLSTDTPYLDNSIILFALDSKNLSTIRVFHLSPLLKAISIFVSPVSILTRRRTGIIG